jgi:hypothetical protein
MPDSSIVLLGGTDSERHYNDVWRSADNGATWKRLTEHAGWSPRFVPGSVVMPDGSIVLTGGFDDTFKNDIWRSTDVGATWTQITPGAEWAKRYGHNSVAMPDGSIVLMGGVTSANPLRYTNDVWRLMPAGSTEQNPLHTYAAPGSYAVALQVYNADGYTSTRKSGSMTAGNAATAISITETVPGENTGTLRNQSAGILVTKSISPKILKQGTDARVTITVLNQGPAPVYDIEILDTTPPEFPVLEGMTQFTTQSIESNGTRILTYTIHAIKSGSFRLNRTAVMYADSYGNYHMTYSDYEKVEVLPSLIPPTPQNGADALIRDFFGWLNGLGKRNGS